MSLERRKADPQLFGKNLINAFVGVSFGVIFALGALVALYAAGNKFASFVVASDLTEIIELVEYSDLEQSEKDHLRRDLEDIRQSARAGKHVGFWLWVDYDESLRSAFAYEEVTESQLASFRRELSRLKQIRDTATDSK